MKVVIAEKPSVARELARFLGATEKKEGYLAGNGYCITWAIGHLIGLGMPEDYGIVRFDPASLPILPENFLLTVRKVKKGKAYVADTGACKQIKVIESLFCHCDSIVVATDAGREGELIFRYIYEYLGCSKPFQRLWISSLTEQAIRRGFQQLKSGHEFDGLFKAARARSRADWLVGINASQALNIAAGHGSYSLGRVQTPTLALVCARYLEHKNFVVQQYWRLALLHRKEFIEFKSLSVQAYEDKQFAEETLNALRRTVTKAVVTSIETKTVTEHPPLLFDLTGLQKEANKKLNFSAEETQNIAQSLYEQKFITYPRTGSPYIPEDMWPEIPKLLRALGDRGSCKQALDKMKWGSFNKRIVNDLRVTDHHGLLVTGKIPSALSAKENAIYDMIALRLLEALSQPCIKALTLLELQLSTYDFKAKGHKIVAAGWRAIKGNFSDDGSVLEQTIPELHQGAELSIQEISLVENRTKAPVLYTEAGLLAAMEQAGNRLEDEEERKALQFVGIGTPATRAGIMATLLSRSYIERANKSLIPTAKGMEVYNLLKDQPIANARMTAAWEMALEGIEHREMDDAVFLKEMEQYTTTITHTLLETPLSTEAAPVLRCPKCKNQKLLIRDKIIKCPEQTCDWRQFRNICGIQLSLTDIENLVCTGTTALLKGLRSKAGKKFDAYIVLDEQGSSSFVFARK